MKWIKTYKRFETLNPLTHIVFEIEKSLKSLESFGFISGLDIKSGFLVIEIKKGVRDDIKVFSKDDILPTLNNINDYLTLGESFKFDSGFVTGVESSFDITDFSELNKFRKGILELLLTYKLPEKF